jgi:golgi SNAP receptor complex member 2
MHSALSQAAQRRALDVINSIGLSDSLLRVIDRRQRMDRWIVYGGMVSWPPNRKQTRPE